MSRDRGEKQTPLVIFWGIVVFVLSLDLLTKFLAISSLSSVETVPVLPDIFHLTLVYNRGIAFGFFRDWPVALIGLITVSLVVLAVWGCKSAKSSRWFETISVALILGGAAGNWLDRIRYGAVVDFFDFRVFPVFNVADSAITVGVVLYIWFLMRKSDA